MNKLNLTSLAELEKLNATELSSIKGGISNTLTANADQSSDSEHHDSNNNDTFEKENCTL